MKHLLDIPDDTRPTFMRGDVRTYQWRPIEPRLLVPLARGELLTLLVPFVGLVFCIGYFVGFSR